MNDKNDNLCEGCESCDLNHPEMCQPDGKGKYNEDGHNGECIHCETCQENGVQQPEE